MAQLPTWSARGLGAFLGTSVQPIRRLVRDGILKPKLRQPRLWLFTDGDVLKADKYLSKGAQ